MAIERWERLVPGNRVGMEWYELNCCGVGQDRMGWDGTQRLGMGGTMGWDGTQ